MEKGFPADAHDAGRWAVDWKKGFPADAHDAFRMVGGLENGFSADAHDARRWAVDWEKGFQLMLMMLAAGRWVGQRVSSRCS